MAARELCTMLACAMLAAGSTAFAAPPAPAKPPSSNKPPPPAKATAAPITVPITNLRNLGKGTLFVRLLGRTERVNGDERPIKQVRLKVTAARMRVELPAVPPGDYAVFVLHDMDGDGKVTTNFIGIPDEDIAISRNGKGGPLGGPKWKDVRFTHGTRPTALAPLKIAQMYD